MARRSCLKHWKSDGRSPADVAGSLAVGVCRAVAMAAIIFGLSQRLRGQDTPDYFRQNCLSCHTIGGGRLTGPDLKDVTQRKDRNWLASFMMNPRAVLDSGDAYALKLLEESRNVPMPTLPGLDRERADKLLDLIEAESKLDESQFRGLQISTRPFTDETKQETTK